MPVDQQISVAGQATAPLSYTVPNAIEAALLCVNANVDGSGASGSFLATVEIVSDGGLVVARCPCFTTIAAGGSAEVSWFRLRDVEPVTSPNTSYESLILNTAGIRLYYKLDETTGTTAHDSGPLGHDLTYYNGVTLGQPPLADVFSATLAAASSQRIGDRVAIPGIVGLNGNGQLSVEFWIKTTYAAAAAIVASDSSSADGRYFSVNLEATGKPSFGIFFSDATGASLFGVTAINDGATHYVVATFDGTTMALYVDGVLDASSTPAHAFPLATENQGVVLGARFTGFPVYDRFLSATLDEVAVYDFALTQTQITQHMAAG